MARHRHAPIVLVAAACSTFAAVGMPLHGHRPHAGHDQAHIEVSHHDHDSGYAQGEERVVPRPPRDIDAPRSAPILPPDAEFEPDREPLRLERAVGRAPPDPNSPRAPPA